ncbi:ocs element-binding factor 1-like protein [Carex littledalei]|uniref:Ocs element-binding factor 1-like protein n=1 Tax=Carex littledalei TaxID=544730 RepID=A0A833QXK0_9POAL|nr:ocs element-binding factor 1-like protein [Carex littledalei]
MASSSGTSSESIQIQNSASEEDLQALMKKRKQKRMLSNRESARRSRLRKQKHLDDLTAQVDQLKKENGQILRALNVATQGYFAVEAENSVLRTQHLELSNRLQSLNEIAFYLSGNGSGGGGEVGFGGGEANNCEGLVRPWSLVPGESMAMYQYC